MLENRAKFKQEEKHLFRELLDGVIDRKNKYLAISTKMGGNKSYITSVGLDWFSNIHFASDLDILKEHRGEQSKSIEINSDTLDILSQRKPDLRRQLVMTVYLAIREYHKFPPALLVAYQDWILDPNHDNWGMDGRALQDSIIHEPLDSRGSVVNLDHKDTRFYALDGQHRLMAIRGLRDLIQGNLFKKDKYGKADKQIITLAKVMQHNEEDKMDENTIKQKLISIMEDEKIGVEIIPAVQRGETRNEAFMRLRAIFVDVNQNAKRPEKGELALLDEDDGFSIVARRMMISHELFHDSDSLRVDGKSSQLNEKSEYYTTLQAIINMAKAYLGEQKGFKHWKDEVCDVKGAGLLRPDDKELEKGRNKLSEYFDAIKNLPSHKRMLQGTSAGEIRSGEAHVLFRPIAQEALAKAIGELEREKGLSPQDICKKLATKDDIKFSDLKLNDPASPFYGVLWDPVSGTMRKQSRYMSLAAKVFCYFLSAAMKDKQRESLKEAVFNSRRFTPNGVDQAKATGLDGNPTTLDEFELPNPW